MPRRRHQVRFQADRGQLLDQPMRALRNLFGKLVVGRNAREAKELIIVFKMSRAHDVTLDRFSRFCYSR